MVKLSSSTVSEILQIIKCKRLDVTLSILSACLQQRAYTTVKARAKFSHTRVGPTADPSVQAVSLRVT